MRLLSRLRLSQGLGDSTLALPAFLTRALPGPRGTKCVYRSHVIELSFKLRRSDMFTVHGGSGAFAPPELRSFGLVIVSINIRLLRSQEHSVGCGSAGRDSVAKGSNEATSSFH